MQSNILLMSDSLYQAQQCLFDRVILTDNLLILAMSGILILVSGVYAILILILRVFVLY